jgi:hypothetical protein
MDKSESLRHSKYAVLHVVWCIKGKSAIELLGKAALRLDR